MPRPYVPELRERQRNRTTNARTNTAASTPRTIPTIVGVLVCAADECVLEGPATMGVFDATNDMEVGLGGDAVAKVLTSTVPMEVAPEGVTVLRAAMTPTTPV